MKDPIWVYWETSKNKTKEPAYITLCRWTMLHQWKDENLIFVNEKNIDMYLPGISNSLKGIQVDVKGRIDSFKRKFISYDRNLAVKSDVIRANLLRFYGGIYVDSGVVALMPMNKYFNLLSSSPDKNFIVSQRQSHGKEHYPVNFYGCSTNSNIIFDYCQTISTLINDKSNFHYNELGASSLTPSVNRYLSEAVVLDESEIQPITFEDAPNLYSSSTVSLEEFELEGMVLFKLFSGPFKGKFNNHSISELYYMDCFLGELFRYALPESIFNDFFSRYSS